MTVFVVIHYYYEEFFGISKICVGDNAAGPLAAGNSCSPPFYAAGFIEVNLTGRYVYLYREGAN